MIRTRRGDWWGALGVAIVLLPALALLLMAAVFAFDLETASERQRTREHLQRLEGAHPGAMERLRERAAQ